MEIDVDVAIITKNFINKYLQTGDKTNDVDIIDNFDEYWKEINDKYSVVDKKYIFALVNLTYSKPNYDKFLSTLYWKIISVFVKVIRGKSYCYFSYDHDRTHLNAHHRTYDIFGEELDHLDELVCLCDHCHSHGHHKKMKEYRVSTSLNNGELEKKLELMNATNNFNDAIDKLTVMMQDLDDSFEATELKINLIHLKQKYLILLQK